jgi:DNA-binding MarR family transcriptional regulator
MRHAIIVNRNDFILERKGRLMAVNASAEPWLPGPSIPAALTGHANYLAVLLGQRAQHLFEQGLVELDMRPSHYDYLATVAERGPLSQRELANALGIDAARVVATTDLFVERGVVTRTVDSADRRRNQIALTAKGRSLVTTATQVAQRVEGQLLAALGPGEAAQLRGLLQRALGVETTPK